MKTRKIIFNGTPYYFNFRSFKEIFNNYAFKNKLTKSGLEEKIADKLHLSKDAIHNWRNELNGPSDINAIKELAKELNINDVTILLRKENNKMNNNLNDLQILSIKRIYDSIIDYLEEFYNTNGFNDLWFDLKCKSEEKPSELCDIALQHVSKLHLVLKKEYMLLKNTDIYKELEEFEYNDIYDTFDSKLTYAYRFEAIPDGNPTTDDDYYKALNKLNAIIEKYI